LIILTSVPMAVFGAFLCLVVLNWGAKGFDLNLGFWQHHFQPWRITASWNIYTKIGVVTLIGLISKHGILIVEFANQLQAQGMNKFDAVIGSATRRLRPILMTTGAMVLGSIPLALAAGAGAEARHQIGWVIVGGMSFGTLLTLFVVPSVYLLIARNHSADLAKQGHMQPAE
jgi:multidrug efflux pump